MKGLMTNLQGIPIDPSKPALISYRIPIWVLSLFLFAFQVKIWILSAVLWHGIDFKATLKWNYRILMQVLCQITGLKWLRVKKVVILKSLDEFML